MVLAQAYITNSEMSKNNTLLNLSELQEATFLKQLLYCKLHYEKCIINIGMLYFCSFL